MPPSQRGTDSVVAAAGSLAGRYNVTRLLGQGGQSRCFLARDQLFETDVVLKEALDADGERFLRHELELLAEIHHPNIVRVLDLISWQGRAVLVQSFAAGPDLGRWAVAERDPLQVGRALAGVLRAVRTLHRAGVVHGDLKPANLRVSPKPTGRLPGVCLIDFGLARALGGLPGARPARRVRATSGTLAYAAPEVLAGDAPGPAADMYAFGVLAYEALFGKLPEHRADPSGTKVDVPRLSGFPGTREVLLDLLNAPARERPDAAAVMRVLAQSCRQDLELSPAELAADYFPATPPLFARQQALALIAHRLDLLARGEPCLLALSGGGKTRTARAAARLARARGFDVTSAASATELLEQVGDGTTDSQQAATRVLDRCLDAAARRPLVLDLDGCQPDEPIVCGLLEQFVRVARQGEAHRCMVLWSAPLPPGLSEHDTVVPLPLRALSSAEVSSLACQMLHAEEPPPWVDDLYQTSGGDVRLVVDLVHQQLIAGLPTRLQPPDAPEVDPAPRLRSLGTAARELVELLAHSPRPISAPVLNQLAPGQSSALGALRDQGLLEQSARGVCIARPAFRRAVLCQVDHDRRRRVHQQYALAYRAAAPHDAAALAHHELHAGLLDAPQIASAPLGEADLLWVVEQASSGTEPWFAAEERLARHELARGLLEASLARAERIAAPQPERGALLRAELLLEAGRPAQAREVLETIPQLLPRALLIRGRAEFLQGRYAEAAEAASQAMHHDRTDASLLPQLLNLAALCELYQGRAETALALLERAEPLGYAPLKTSIRQLNSKGMVLQRLGRTAEALEAYRSCLERARRLGDLRAAASAALNLATVGQRGGELTEALSGYQLAAHLATRAGAVTTRASALANEALLRAICGDLEQAAGRALVAVELARDAGASAVAGRALLYAALIALRRGRMSEATQHLERAQQSIGEVDHSAITATMLLQCDLELQRGDARSAQQRAALLLEQLDGGDPDRFRAHELLAKAELLLPARDLERAVTELQLAAALCRRHASEAQAWECLALLGRCQLEAGEHEAARYYAQRSARALKQLRQAVPAELREAFDRRQEVQGALEIVRQIEAHSPAPAAKDAPSAEDLEALIAINKRLSGKSDISELWQAILDGAIELTGAERGFVLLREHDRLLVSASRNVDGESVRKGYEKFSHSIAASAMRDGSTIVAADAMADGRFADQLSVHGLRLRAVLCVPLRVEGAVRGALYVDNRFRSGAFTRRHVWLAEAFADQASIALFNAGLLRDAEARERTLGAAQAELAQANHKLEAMVQSQADQLEAMNERLRSHDEELVTRYNAVKLIGRSKAMRKLFQQIDRVTESPVSVFICGESGSGKELVARAIHCHGPRRDQPFVSLNCAAVPQSLLESELFGHVRGAFTGAVNNRAGLFEVAGSGTILLDEIGDMPPEMQVKLLRVLQEGRYRRIGESHERESRCRVLSASHRQLDQLVSQGAFREDLYYRVNVIELCVPPLRERLEDIPELVTHLLTELGSPSRVTPAAMAALMDYPWPGNVRQLANELHRAAVLGNGQIDVANLSPRIAPNQLYPSENEGLQAAVQSFERRFIERVLEESGGSVTETAERLGLHRVALHRKIRKMGIDLQEARRKAGE